MNIGRLTLQAADVTGDAMIFDEIRDFCDGLEAHGLSRFSFNWGITESAILRGAGRPVQTIEGSDTDSRLDEYRLADGSALWRIALYSQDTAEGIPYFSDTFILAQADVIARAQAIEDWLAQNRDAYEVFAPIKWSAAPDRAAKAKAWMDANRARWETSPLAEIYHDLYTELSRVVGEA